MIDDATLNVTGRASVGAFDAVRATLARYVFVFSTDGSARSTSRAGLLSTVAVSHPLAPVYVTLVLRLAIAVQLPLLSVIGSVSTTAVRSAKPASVRDVTDTESCGARNASQGVIPMGSDGSAKAENWIVRVPPPPVTARLVKATTPFVACAVAPVSTPPPAAIVAVTVSTAFVARLPALSSTSSTGWVMNGELSPPPAGERRNASAAGGPARTENVAVFTVVRPVAEKASERGPANPENVSCENVAMPCTDATVVTPAIVPTPSPKLTVTGTPAAVTRLSNASRTSTTGAIVNDVPDATSPGCVRTNSLAGAPAVTVTAIEPVTPNDAALMVVLPTVAAVTIPSGDTTATVGVLELHTTLGDVTSCARLSVTRAESCTVAPAATVALPPLTATVTAGGTSGVTGSSPPPHAAESNNSASDRSLPGVTIFSPTFIAAPEQSP